MPRPREYRSVCRVYSTTYRDNRLPTWHETAPNMLGALAEWDPFQSAAHWPLHSVGHYLGRMGVGL